MVWWILVEFQKSAWRYADSGTKQRVECWEKLSCFSFTDGLDYCPFHVVLTWRCASIQTHTLKSTLFFALTPFSLCGWEIGLLRAYESLKSHVRLTINFDQIEREPLVMPPWEYMMRIFGFFFRYVGVLFAWQQLDVRLIHEYFSC